MHVKKSIWKGYLLELSYAIWIRCYLDIQIVMSNRSLLDNIMPTGAVHFCVWGGCYWILQCVLLPTMMNYNTTIIIMVVLQHHKSYATSHGTTLLLLAGRSPRCPLFAALHLFECACRPTYTQRNDYIISDHRESRFLSESVLENNNNNGCVLSAKPVLLACRLLPHLNFPCGRVEQDSRVQASRVV